MPTRSTTKILGAEVAELEGALLGDDAADQEANQRDDRHGLEAGAVEMVDDRGEAEARRDGGRARERPRTTPPRMPRAWTSRPEASTIVGRAPRAARTKQVAAAARGRCVAVLDRTRAGRRAFSDRPVISTATPPSARPRRAGDQPGAGGVDVARPRRGRGRRGRARRRRRVAATGSSNSRGVDRPMRRARTGASSPPSAIALERPAENGVGIGHRRRRPEMLASACLEPTARAP